MRRTVMATLAAAVLLACGVIGQQAPPQDVALQAAIRTETVDGDLHKAIAQYEAIAKRSDRAAAAQALLRMADCYQKLGDAQARTTYERLVREFSDQTQAVTVAQARLNQSRTSGSGIVARQLWTTTGYTQVSIAEDGRRAAIAEADVPDIQIRDLSSGGRSFIKAIENPASGGYLEWPILSPDFKQVAFAWAGPESKWDYQVKIMAAQSGAKPRSVGHAFGYVFIKGWSADAKSLLVNIADAGSTTRIGWMSIADGSIRTLKTLDWQDAGSIALSPDGKFIAYDVLVERGKPEREIRILAADASTESVIVPAPGINASPVWSRDGARLVFKSNRSGTFGIWSVPVNRGRSDGPWTQLKTDVGDVELFGFSAAGSLFFGQSVGKRDVLSIELDPVKGALRGAATRVVDTYVGANTNPSLSHDGKLLAYLSQRTQGLGGNWAQLVIRSQDTGVERALPTLFRYGGKPLWMPDGQSLIEVARDGQNHTTLYKVDLKSGDVTTLVSTGESMPNSAGLSADGRTAYVGWKVPTAPDGYQLTTYDLASGRHAEAQHAGTSRGIAASPDGRSVAFIASEDVTPPLRTHIYVAEADGTRPRAVLSVDKTSDSLVKMSLAWSPDSQFIYFVKRGQGSLWRVPAAGGSPELVGDLSAPAIGSIDISPDGRRVIYGVGGPPTVEVWALESLLPQ